MQARDYAVMPHRQLLQELQFFTKWRTPVRYMSNRTLVACFIQLKGHCIAFGVVLIDAAIVV